jgi:hypothetical protein
MKFQSCRMFLCKLYCILYSLWILGEYHKYCIQLPCPVGLRNVSHTATLIVMVITELKSCAHLLILKIYFLKPPMLSKVTGTYEGGWNAERERERERAYSKRLKQTCWRQHVTLNAQNSPKHGHRLPWRSLVLQGGAFHFGVKFMRCQTK